MMVRRPHRRARRSCAAARRRKRLEALEHSLFMPLTDNAEYRGFVALWDLPRHAQKWNGSTAGGGAGVGKFTAVLLPERFLTAMVRPKLHTRALETPEAPPCCTDTPTAGTSTAAKPVHSEHAYGVSLAPPQEGPSEHGKRTVAPRWPKGADSRARSCEIGHGLLQPPTREKKKPNGPPPAVHVNMPKSGQRLTIGSKQLMLRQIRVVQQTPQTLLRLFIAILIAGRATAKQNYESTACIVSVSPPQAQKQTNDVGSRTNIARLGYTHMSEVFHRFGGHALSKAGRKDVLVPPLRLRLSAHRVDHETPFFRTAWKRAKRRRTRQQ